MLAALPPIPGRSGVVTCARALAGTAAGEARREPQRQPGVQPRSAGSAGTGKAFLGNQGVLAHVLPGEHSFEHVKLAAPVLR